ncbi:GDSL esterase/lipase At5g45950-like [Phalaenopsis equestris]|uniref:GDSL esterase/lipase At5g45950-like n=1 Tax=Phalaenopsis equestris TaxID=78828 RepID=UPI0009E4F4F5|nr:GDSL esterase/lipase At5g45950-like [Phalaenopsis equestris]
MESKISIEVLVVLLFLFTGQNVSGRKDLKQPVSAATQIKCLLVFGDSTVDPGNNNKLNTTLKANFKPYGIHFLRSRPTGRHSDGLLSPDIIADFLGIAKFIPAYLDPDLTVKQLRRGVSFASAGAGLDILTDAALNVLTFPKQIELFKEYKLRLQSSIGQHKTERTIAHSLVIISTGTNDFIQNYFTTTTRSKQYTVEQYVDFLIARISNHVEEIHKNGPRAFSVSELGPIGCLPIIRKLIGGGSCYAPINDAALYFNSKLVIAVSELKLKLGINISISASYKILYDAITSPAKYGFTDGEKGCCGTGFFEYGETCKGQKLCSNILSHVFFDAVHPSQKMYQLILLNSTFSKIGNGWPDHN